MAVVGTVTALASTHPAAYASSSDQPEARIVGGSPSGPEQAPWMVALTDRYGNQFCGGTLIAAGKVVTAAHCAYDTLTGAQRAPEDFQVIAGRTDLHAQNGTVSSVQGVWVYPRYRNFTSGDDVAVLTLSKPVPEEPLPMVQPGDTAPYQPGNMARVYGWGRTSENGPVSETLRSVKVPVEADATCKKAYPNYDAQSMFCAGYPQGGKDACAGDSGGPIVADDKLIGVVSYGTGCGRPGAPGVYTRLANFVPLGSGLL